MDSDIRLQVIELLSESGKSHHQAFASTGGKDPEWPLWYAEFLQTPLGKVLHTKFSRSELVYCLMFVEFERSARDPGSAWAPYYADHFLERFAPARDASTDVLALYMFPGCPFCWRVQRAINKLGIEVETRDVQDVPQHLQDLVTARDRGTVPVLRISSPTGEERWLPESSDIIRYLKANYGK